MYSFKHKPSKQEVSVERQVIHLFIYFANKGKLFKFHKSYFWENTTVFN